MASKVFSRNKNLLVMCESAGWQWGLGLEFVNSEIERGKTYEVLDLSFLGELNLKTLARLILGGFKIRRKCINHLESREIQVRVLKYKLLRERKYLSSIPLDQSPSLNSIVEKSETIDLDYIMTRRNTRKIIRKENKKRDLIYAVMNNLDFQLYEQVVTVNGRFTKSNTVRYVCKKKKVPFQLIEYGCKKDSFEVFTESPHSIHEVSNKIIDFWNKSSEPQRTAVASKFINNIVKKNSLPGINFREKMIAGRIPRLSDKKICVFFASSEWEYIGVGDNVENNTFRSQVEAFKALIHCLDANKWDIYLRRHPFSPKSNQVDGEFIIWKEFYKKNNIFMIEPNSVIDSISLGERADLITGFGSTILAEFLARGYQNVVTLGPAPWNELIPDRYCPTYEAITNFLTSEKKPFSIGQLHPWAYFQAESGTPFKIITAYFKDE
jgi:hypothetical protein